MRTSERPHARNLLDAGETTEFKSSALKVNDSGLRLHIESLFIFKIVLNDSISYKSPTWITIISQQQFGEK